MSLTITKHRSMKSITEYEHRFENIDCKGSGYGFPCAKDGTPHNHDGAWLENYRKCTSGEYNVRDQGICSSEREFIDYADGKCSCGSTITLFHPLDNTCNGCGTCYNSSGQTVTPSYECNEQGEPYSDYEN